jgi:hypothetical protein
MGLTASIVAVAIVFGILMAITAFGIARVETAHPPAGRFVEVEGVRLHMAELGIARGRPGAEPAIVLVHGASGNLEDMRLAVGEMLAKSHRVILIDRPRAPTYNHRSKALPLSISDAWVTSADQRLDENYLVALSCPAPSEHMTEAG